jgi:hypothetical protein
VSSEVAAAAVVVIIVVVVVIFVILDFFVQYGILVASTTHSFILFLVSHH